MWEGTRTTTAAAAPTVAEKHRGILQLVLIFLD